MYKFFSSENCFWLHGESGYEDRIQSNILEVFFNKRNQKLSTSHCYHTDCVLIRLLISENCLQKVKTFYGIYD